MKYKLSNQFLSHIKRFIQRQDRGEMINITEVYEDYGKPKFLSPRKLLRYRPLRMLAEFLIKNNNYEIEKVIIYKGKDVYVCYDLAMSYLTNLDPSNYIILNDYLIKVGGLNEIVKLMDK